MNAKAAKIKGVKVQKSIGGESRKQTGFQLVELTIALSVGSVLMMSTYGTSVGFYRASSNNENQVIASNMAQQVIDNARNSTYNKLQSLLGGSSLATQQLSLFDFPSNPQTAMFPRPLLRNMNAAAGMTYTDQSSNKLFNGTVTETIQDLTPGNANNGQLRITVLVQWKDSRGPHQYQSATTISQTGIHN